MKMKWRKKMKLHSVMNIGQTPTSVFGHTMLTWSGNLSAHHHAQAEEELERLHEPWVVQFGYNEESEDDDQDNFPLQPVDCNHKAADASQ